MGLFKRHLLYLSKREYHIRVAILKGIHLYEGRVRGGVARRTVQGSQPG